MCQTLFKQKRFGILVSGIRFVNIEDSIKMILVCVALHNYIIMNEKDDAFNVPKPFQENNDKEGLPNVEENEELEEIVGMSTSERIMRKYFQNPNP